MCPRCWLALGDLTAAWLAHLRERDLSPRTIATYARTMRTLPGADTATREDIESWWASRAHLSVATRNNELAAVRAFYHWCVAWDHRPDDPTRRLVPPRKPQGLPHPISRHDLHKLLDTLPPDLRRAVCLGAYGGLRISEAAAAHWHDVDVEHRRLRVTGKGGKVRLVGISAVLMDSLLPDMGGNIVTGTGVEWKADTLQRRINRAFRRADVDTTFHSLRHRFGTMALAGSGNLLAVSRAMGHASPSTTAIYAATSDADLDVIADAVIR